MIDDLVLQGVTEPYRMLTARAEYRLRLRSDNAQARLTPQAMAIGCVSAGRQESFRWKCEQRARLETLLTRGFTGRAVREAGAEVRDDGTRNELRTWLRFPEVGAAALYRLVPELGEIPPAILEEAVQDHRYAPYLERQDSDVARMKRDEAVLIPPHLEYSLIAGLSNEMVEKLSAARPATLGAAARIRGITPAALAAILVHIRRRAA
jgi:tRNA uridine 5-carboxymethylaminomethyl modification enzyme